MARRPRQENAQRRPAAGGRARAAARRPPDSAPLPGGHPALVTATIVTALCVLVSVTFTLYDTDFWHHLLVGRVIWESRSIPTQQLWSWPTWGAPEANSAWLFRALVWPFWSLGGIGGLFAWRWLTTLVAFGVMWGTARRMGARGFAPLVALLLCAFIYRLRSQVRPETLVAVLVALEIWILETRRRGGPACSPRWGWAPSSIPICRAAR